MFAMVVYNAASDGLRNSVVDAALLGRKEQSSSLTGRLPLWEELVKDAAKRPVLGYGYEGFWTEDRIAGILKSQNWTLQNAHNSYFEIVLQLGLVGFFFAVWFLLSGSGALFAANSLTREPGYAFAFGTVVFGLANSTMESLFVRVRYCPSIALVGLLMVALFFPREEDYEDDDDDDDGGEEA
jgi:O-antigen ligase